MAGSRPSAAEALDRAQRAELTARNGYAANPIPEDRDAPGPEWPLIPSWQAVLSGEQTVSPGSAACESIRVIDLFSATGGFALGAKYFCWDNHYALDSVAAIDVDADALAVHRANHQTTHLVPQSVDSLVDFRIRGQRTEATFSYTPELVGEGEQLVDGAIDLVLAGPPCQGHSNLNNHTRRDDRRNFYYLSAAAFAVAADAGSVVIENVPAVTRDRAGVVETARTLLRAAGYAVEEGVLAADKMGWPQTRKRHFLVARRDGPPAAIDHVQEALGAERPMTVIQAIGGMLQSFRDDGRSGLHAPTETTEVIEDRINWLFDNDEFNLPNEERPDSHKGGHTYGASYGRMYPDKPAPTITTGFTTPGRGRFIHPTQRRTITPAEAARLQGFPDTYEWCPTPDSPPTRTQLAKWIGDAVPLPLGYAAAMSALWPDLMDHLPKAADRDAKAA